MERRSMIGVLFGTGALSLLLGSFMGHKTAEALIRPPGALDETDFLANCARCGKCAQVCPKKAIVMGHGDKGLSIGTPYIIPRQEACDLCLDCVKACTTGALRPVEKEQVKMGVADIDRDKCLAWQGDECKICYTACPFYDKAIILQNHKLPVVDRNFCAGCGQCEHVCIAQPAAITVKARET